MDINLLPQKEKKRSTTLFFVFAFLLIVFAAGAYSWFLYKQLAQENIRLEQQLAYTQKLREVQANTKVESAGQTAAKQLETAIQWAEEYPVSTYLILRHFASLLPERGFILTFSYEDSGNAQCSVQFDSSREAAFYLKSLTDSKLIKEAKLNSLVTEGTEEENRAQTGTAGNIETPLPRYIAQYSLTIDKAELKKAEEEGRVRQQ
ncbi:PilN domain-containing protein [Peribacillus saganii]|uniref:PilN domain-containing protein n=1 Tax=Peribacillus saganii TaxID=2303992 RepID=UPI00115E0FFC|nr:hypothetical protein [Peribacillus saganii]